VFEFSRYAGLKLFSVNLQRTVGTAVHSCWCMVDEFLSTTESQSLFWLHFKHISKSFNQHTN